MITWFKIWHSVKFTDPRCLFEASCIFSGSCYDKIYRTCVTILPSGKTKETCSKNKSKSPSHLCIWNTAKFIVCFLFTADCSSPVKKAAKVEIQNDEGTCNNRLPSCHWSRFTDIFPWIKLNSIIVMSLFLFILESEEVKPHKVIFKPSILSDVAKNLVTSSSKGNY